MLPAQNPRTSCLTRISTVNESTCQDGGIVLLSFRALFTRRGNLYPYKKPPLCKGRGTAIAVEGLASPILSFESATKAIHYPFPA